MSNLKTTRKTSPREMLRYGGVSRESWEQLQDQVDEYNRKNIRIYSAIVLSFFAVAAVLSFFAESMDNKRPIYIACVISGILCLGVERFLREKGRRPVICVAVFELLFLSCAAAMS